MPHLNILTRAEIESLGPPALDELDDTGVAQAFLCDLTLKHVAIASRSQHGYRRRSAQAAEAR